MALTARAPHYGGRPIPAGATGTPGDGTETDGAETAASPAATELLAPDEVLLAGESEVGGKALGLARIDALLASWRPGGGSPPPAQVPAFRVLPSSAFRSHLSDPRVADRLGGAFVALADADPTDPAGRLTVEACSRQLHSAVLAVPLSPAVEASVLRALADLGPGPWCVRSSMAGEDSATHSFAGQLESFLVLPDQAAVLEGILACWASAFSPRALTYAMAAGMHPAAVRVAVVLQRMVSPVGSGVMFTVNPTNGRRDEVLVTAAWGLGEGVVSGRCNADEYVWSDSSGDVRADLGDKDLEVVPAPSGRGTAEVATSEDRRHGRTLTTGQVRELALLGRHIAGASGCPQDVEFAWAGSTLWLLQSRPVTANLPASPAAGAEIVWDNSNIQESYCGVTTPLTFSFASRAYATVYETFFRMAGTPERTIEAKRHLFDNLLGLIEGRVFYNLNTWYEGCLLLPSPDHTKDDMEKMMGVDEPVDFVVDEGAPAGARLARMAAMAPVVARLIPQLATIDRRISRFRARFDAVTGSIDRDALASMTLAELTAVVETLDREVTARWDVPILNDVRVLRASGTVRRTVASALGTNGDDPEVGRLVSDLLAGIDGIESVGPTRMLLSIAAQARDDERVAGLLRAGGPADALGALRLRAPAFARRIDAYIDRYGDRVMGELKLETISLRDDPAFVVQVLRNYLCHEDLDLHRGLEREGHTFSQALASVQASLPARRRQAFARAVTGYRHAVKDREALRLDRTRLFGLYRDVYLAIGARLADAGRLGARRDIFWLTTSEIADYCAGRAVTTDLAGLARLRSAEFARFAEVEVPNRVVTHGPPYHGNVLTRRGPEPDAPAGPVLTGTACYPGIVEAPVRVVHDAGDELSLNGRILVALRTDPGWAPLFPTCSGLLVERGSTLSHSAVVARELGIPTIVGIRGLVRALDDGEIVTMDGSEGTVRRTLGSGERGCAGSPTEVARS